MKISLIFLILSNYWMLSLFLFWGYLPTKTIADRLEDNKNLSVVLDERTKAVIKYTNHIQTILLHEEIDPMALIYDVFPETKVLQNKDISKFYDPNALGSNVGLFEHPIGLSTRIVFINSWSSDRSIPVDHVLRRVILYLRRLRELCRKIIHNYETNDSRERLRLTPDMIKLDHEIYQIAIVSHSSFRDFHKPNREEITRFMTRKEAIRMALLQIDGILLKMKINPNSSIYEILPETNPVKNSSRIYDIYNPRLYNETIDIFKLPIGQTFKMAFETIWKHKDSIPVNHVKTRVEIFSINLIDLALYILNDIKKDIFPNKTKYALIPDMIVGILEFKIVPTI